MPKHNKRPTEFISDAEDDGPMVSTIEPGGPSAPTERDRKPVVAMTAPPAPRGINHARGDYAPLLSAEPQPIVPSKEGYQQVQLAELLSVLTTSNARMKGRIDDSGRFELKFELNRDPKPKHGRRGRTPSPPPYIQSASPTSPKAERAKHGRLIGWTRSSRSPTL